MCSPARERHLPVTRLKQDAARVPYPVVPWPSWILPVCLAETVQPCFTVVGAMLFPCSYRVAPGTERKEEKQVWSGWVACHRGVSRNGCAGVSEDTRAATRFVERRKTPTGNVRSDEGTAYFCWKGCGCGTWIHMWKLAFAELLLKICFFNALVLIQRNITMSTSDNRCSGFGSSSVWLWTQLGSDGRSWAVTECETCRLFREATKQPLPSG